MTETAVIINPETFLAEKFCYFRSQRKTRVLRRDTGMCDACLHGKHLLCQSPKCPCMCAEVLDRIARG